MFTKEVLPYPGSTLVRVIVKHNRRIVRVKCFTTADVATKWLAIQFPSAVQWQELTCNCDVPNQIQCDLHGPRE